MRAFVTGAGGFIGAHLAEELIKQGHEVTGLFMPEEDSRRAEEAGIMICRGDITRPETLEGLFDKVDIVFHLATRTSDWGGQSRGRHPPGRGIRCRNKSDLSLQR